MRVNVRALITAKDSIILCYSKRYDFWFLPGGKLEEGESFDDNIKRELLEEMGIPPESINIDPEITTIEYFFELDGEKHHQINIIKRVHVPMDDISSKEEHIVFEKVKFADIKSKNIKPKAMKTWLMDLLN